ncbi:BlaI/MecI/CopY family transcriptional regulator [uncultured Pseudoteredinibacter sp.]|uniref:BlaI/MecI/CopY family transcriptional regulator n=1 Tax=uncultured Pseudoteredinibacter sp. TaxID=1641701 RepID=UPI0026219C8A|nr:BlaI/MecI/CopY family transcriptional regulator [uncultured Pseudoteredinibacter sp.]
MSKTSQKLSRRERQILDVLYERQPASAKEVQAGISDAPSYSSVRALLARMVEKGLVSHQQDGAKYLYSAVTAKDDASQSAMGRLVRTFFGGSALKAASALIGNAKEELNEQELESLEKMIRQARERKQQEPK